MKVDVIHATEAQFKRWCIWSDWIDIVIFDHGYQSYLVQMSMTRRNRKRFRCISTTGHSHASVAASVLGDLMPMIRGTNDAT